MPGERLVEEPVERGLVDPELGSILGKPCGRLSSAPAEHLRTTQHGPAQAIRALITHRLTDGEQAGNSRLAVGIDPDPTVARVVMELHLQQVALPVDLVRG